MQEQLNRDVIIFLSNESARRKKLMVTKRITTREIAKELRKSTVKIIITLNILEKRGIIKKCEKQYTKSDNHKRKHVTWELL